MRLITVNTGSAGNCYLIAHKGKYIALDAGCKWKDVMIACDFAVANMTACLVTHSHLDHSQYKRTFARNGILVFSPDNTETNKRIRADDISFVAFSVPHTNTDGSPCENYAYMIDVDGGRFLYLTDWMFCPYILSKFDINHFLIAVNYTELSNMEESMNHVLKGHSSLDTAVKFLESSMTDACKSITACHLSDRNADENLILDTLRNVAGSNVNVNIAHKGKVIDL